MKKAQNPYSTLKKFYPYYLTQHQDAVCREYHFTGTFLLFVLLFNTIIFQKFWLLLLLPVVGYGFAWAGHFFFEKNKPAAFNNPLYSLASDFIMFWHILTGRIDDEMHRAQKEVTTRIEAD